MIVTTICDIPNKRGYVSLSFDRSVILIEFDLIFFQFNTDFFHLYFLNIDNCIIYYLSYGYEFFNRGQTHSYGGISDFGYMV